MLFFLLIKRIAYALNKAILRLYNSNSDNLFALLKIVLKLNIINF